MLACFWVLSVALACQGARLEDELSDDVFELSSDTSSMLFSSSSEERNSSFMIVDSGIVASNETEDLSSEKNRTEFPTLLPIVHFDPSKRLPLHPPKVENIEKDTVLEEENEDPFLAEEQVQDRENMPIIEESNDWENETVQVDTTMGSTSKASSMEVVPFNAFKGSDLDSFVHAESSTITIEKEDTPITTKNTPGTTTEGSTTGAGTPSSSATEAHASGTSAKVDVMSTTGGVIGSIPMDSSPTSTASSTRKSTTPFLMEFSPITSTPPEDDEDMMEDEESEEVTTQTMRATTEEELFNPFETEKDIFEEHLTNPFQQTTTSLAVSDVFSSVTPSLPFSSPSLPETFSSTVAPSVSQEGTPSTSQPRTSVSIRITPSKQKSDGSSASHRLSGEVGGHGMSTSSPRDDSTILHTSITLSPTTTASSSVQPTAFRSFDTDAVSTSTTNVPSSFHPTWPPPAVIEPEIVGTTLPPTAASTPVQQLLREMASRIVEQTNEPIMPPSRLTTKLVVHRLLPSSTTTTTMKATTRTTTQKTTSQVTTGTTSTTTHEEMDTETSLEFEMDAIAHKTSFSIRITSIEFSPEFLDSNSGKFRKLSEQLLPTLRDMFGSLLGDFIGVELDRFSSGSVVVHGNVYTQHPLEDIDALILRFENELHQRDNMIGQISIDPRSINIDGINSHAFVSHMHSSLTSDASFTFIVACVITVGIIITIIAAFIVIAMNSRRTVGSLKLKNDEFRAAENGSGQYMTHYRHVNLMGFMQDSPPIPPSHSPPSVPSTIRGSPRQTPTNFASRHC